ncbi:hypothetical protein ES708_23608 [subsurface metagenome]
MALFVSSGAKGIEEIEEDKEQTNRARRKYLEEKAAKYGLRPISMRVFGGVWDFHKMPWWSRKAMEEFKLKLETSSIQETRPGVFDTRNWEDVRNWAKELVNLMIKEVR